MKSCLLTITVVIQLFGSSALMASVSDHSFSKPRDSEDVRVVLLIARLDEIHDLDLASISHHDKRALRKEVRVITQELKELDGDGGTYIFLGGMLLAIILLNIWL